MRRVLEALGSGVVVYVIIAACSSVEGPPTFATLDGGIPAPRERMRERDARNPDGGQPMSAREPSAGPPAPSQSIQPDSPAGPLVDAGGGAMGSMMDPVPPAAAQTPGAPVVLSGSASARCELVTSQTITITTDGGAQSSTSETFAAQVEVPGLSVDTLVSAFATAVFTVATADPCEAYEATAGVTCTSTTTGDPLSNEAMPAYLSGSRLYFPCGTRSRSVLSDGSVVEGAGIYIEEVTFHYNYRD